MNWRGQTNLFKFGIPHPIYGSAAITNCEVANMPEEKVKNAPPVHKIRVGNVVCSIWQHTTKEGVFHNVSMEKNYKDEDVWKASGNLNINEIPKAQLALAQAYAWIMQSSKDKTE
jgi:hypothetical protein